MYAKKVLFATLNWGLGHTTRSIPIIKELQSRGYEIIIASDGIAGLVLQREFPLLPYFELPSYQITYSPHSFYYHWIQQLPKLRQAISIEHKRIAEIVSSNQVDVVISDNRYGVYHPTTKNIFITHQLSFALPFPINKLLSHQIRVMVNRFDQCWIPDYPTQDNLTGLLSTGKIAIEKVFIGPISRFKPQEGERKFDLGVIISGPEPLRTTLQNELLAKLDQTWKTFWVLGKPGANASNEAQNQYAHLNTD
ncbi:MAG: hypothetical protein KDC53_11610, partial [Saprospiraceae bacterium]|nr:hypothetical protein [Saprospiraceae bacterium]